MSGVHDNLVKETFTKREHAIVQLRAVLPPAVLAAIDLDQLEVVAGSFVDADLIAVHTDILYRVPVSAAPNDETAPRSLHIYALFEHQSTVDKLMPLRMLRSIVRVFDQHLADGGKLPLPVVLPIVLHHSATGWTAATELHKLFDEQLLALKGVAELVPQFRFVLDDISHASGAYSSRVAAQRGASAVADTQTNPTRKARS